eukprot:gene21271-23345_t
MEELVNGLRRAVKVLEKCGARDKSLQREDEQLRDERDSQEASWYENSTPSTATLLSSDVGNTRCDFCLRPHQSFECQKYVTAKERMDVLKRYRRCFRCLQKGHVVRSCAVRENCKKCKQGHHHEALCEEQAEAMNITEPTGLWKESSPTAAVMLKVSTENGATKAHEANEPAIEAEKEKQRAVERQPEAAGNSTKQISTISEWVNRDWSD